MVYVVPKMKTAALKGRSIGRKAFFLLTTRNPSTRILSGRYSRLAMPFIKSPKGKKRL